MSESSKIEMLRQTSSPSMPLRRGLERHGDSRSTSSELQPGGWVMTSTSRRHRVGVGLDVEVGEGPECRPAMIDGHQRSHPERRGAGDVGDEIA